MARRDRGARPARRYGPGTPAAAAVRLAEPGAADSAPRPGRDARRDARRGRAVVELLAHLGGDGPEVDGRWRSWRIGRRPLGGVPHLLQPAAGRREGPPPARSPRRRRRQSRWCRRHLQAALQAGDVNATVGAFAPDGYHRGPSEARRPTVGRRAAVVLHGVLRLWRRDRPRTLRRDQRRRAMRAPSTTACAGVITT